MTIEIETLAARLKQFADARDWEKFHTPKNLAMALSVEVSELAEIFQWMTAEESANVMKDQKSADAVKDELADIALYLVRLSSILKVDLLAEANAKIDRNEMRFLRDSATMAIAKPHATTAISIACTRCWLMRNIVYPTRDITSGAVLSLTSVRNSVAYTPLQNDLLGQSISNPKFRPPQRHEPAWPVF